MPPVEVPSSDEVDDSDVAFKVLNQDNLPVATISETILKQFGNNLNKQKPNGIVYPTRRVTTNLEENNQKQFAKSNGCISNALEDEANLKRGFSNSHGNLNHCNSASKLKIHDLNNYIPDKRFTKTLDAKLRRLQREEKIKRTNDVAKKPLFVTTVKKGQFLEPPPEIASLLGFKVDQTKKEEKKLYAYSSKPRVLNKTSNALGLTHKTRCEAAAKAAAFISSNVVGISPDEIKDVNFNVTKRIG